MAELGEDDRRCQWWTANAAGHQRMLEAGGFAITTKLGPFAVPFGAAHPSTRPQTRRDRASELFRRAAMHGKDGVPHAALLAKPR
jgi:hypothetical protein